jgi:hypothetical protein
MGLSEEDAALSLVTMPPMSNVTTKSPAADWRFFHLRNWMGMPLSVWLPLLARNRFAVTRVGQAVRMMVFAAGNSVLHRVDQLVYSRRIAGRPAPQPPLFVVGHWRSGTTMLHELLVRDRHFGFPTTYQAMSPHHFVLTERLFPRLFNHALPARRPMDDMAMGFDKPQEDEFALCNLGLPSPYVRWAFPNHYRTPGLYLDLEELSAADRQRWVAGFDEFLRRVAWREPRRLVLKSPTHTARVRTLASLYPGAQFIHIVRNPYEIFASTVYTWRRLWDAMGFHKPDFADLEEYVLETFVQMYRSFEAARPTLDGSRLHELRYDQLLADPLGELQRIYERLSLDGFEQARPAFESYFADRRDYKPNRHALSADLRQQIAERWSDYFQRYGYDPTEGESRPPVPFGAA